jgi:HEAT repeat protein
MAFQAGYGLVELGAAAVPALVEAASTSETPLIRSRAIDVLGDIGPVSVITITLAI